MEPNLENPGEKKIDETRASFLYWPCTQDTSSEPNPPGSLPGRPWVQSVSGQTACKLVVGGGMHLGRVS